jgi:hypothetical protein
VKRSVGMLFASGATGLAVLLVVGGGAFAGKTGHSALFDAAAGNLKPAKLVTAKNGKTVTRTLPFLSAGTVEAADEALGAGDERLEGADATPDIADADFSDIGGTHSTLGCAKRDGKGNTRVNQDCTFRRQAEELITYNPADPRKLVAGQNDSRVGYNQCGIDYSISNGEHWGDLLPPFRQRRNAPENMGPSASNPNNNTIAGGNGTGHTYDAGSDPALAVDSQGRAFFSCVTFDVASNASGLYVTQSPQGADGSFYFNIPDTPNKRFMVVEDNNCCVFHDKNFIAADRYRQSPNRDNVYVTWTIFRFDAAGNYQRSPIYGSMSTDHAVTWSTPEEISGTSDTLCFFGNFFDPTQPQHACNFDQGSDPVAMPDGSLVVTFNNGNTPAGNPNGQQLAVVCHPTGSSTAGTAHLNCASPSKVGDDIITGEPLCNFGRGPEECIPGAFIRTNDFPRITQDNTQNNHVYVVWQDYRNGEFDIHMSMSTDGGLTWTDAGQVNPDTGLDHYFAATDQSPQKGDREGVSYYRTERVPNENTTPSGGFAPGQPGVQASDSDYVLAGGTADNTPYDFKVVSPVFPPPDGVQAGFNGDYSGLTINRGDEAHPIWSDTRNADPFTPANGLVHDEDVFTDRVGLPNGKGKPGPGKIGKD